MNRLQRLSLLLTLLPLTSALASAQGLVYELGLEATNGDDLGRSVAGAGDVDRDGIPDVIVGAPFDDAAGTDSGSVFVYSGRTGELLWTRSGASTGDAFGWTVDGVGDIDGDGASDVIVGAPLCDSSGLQNIGRAYLLSGIDGTEIAWHSLYQEGGQFGTVVRGLGDIDWDGIGDYAVGSPYIDYAPIIYDCGRFDVYSGSTRTRIFYKNTNDPGAKLGYSLGVIRATSNPGTSRIMVGAPGADGLGTDLGNVQIYDGYGNLLGILWGPSNQSWFGAAVAGIGDATGDGVYDFAIGAPYTDSSSIGADVGAVNVFSGATFIKEYTLYGPAAGAVFGSAVDGLGDFDGDGIDDFLVGAPYHDAGGLVDSGEARIVSGINGATLASYAGVSKNDHMGTAVSSAGDLNGDGTADFILGANRAPWGAGRAYVHLSNLGEPVSYCTAKMNSLGCLPRIAAEGTPSLSIANDFHVSAQNVLNEQFGVLLWSHGANSVPFMGGTLCVLSPIVRTPTQGSGGNPGQDDCSGTYDFHFSHAYLAGAGALAGDRLHAQYWSRDPDAPFAVGLTDAVAFDIVP